jgi:hypothetical protein
VERVKALGETPEQAAAYIARSSGHNPEELARIARAHSQDELLKLKNANDPRSLYQRLAGEVEARTTEKRMDMTPEQRAARPPWLDYDVPEAQMIIK